MKTSNNLPQIGYTKKIAHEDNANTHPQENTPALPDDLQSVSMTPVPGERIRLLWSGRVKETTSSTMIPGIISTYRRDPASRQMLPVSEQGNVHPLTYSYSQEVTDLAKKWKVEHKATAAAIIECLIRQGNNIEFINTLNAEDIYFHRSQPIQFTKPGTGNVRYLLGSGHTSHGSYYFILRDRSTAGMSGWLNENDTKALEEPYYNQYTHPGLKYSADSRASPLYSESPHKRAPGVSSALLEFIVSLKKEIYNTFAADQEKSGEYARLRCTLADIVNINGKVHMSTERLTGDATVEAVVIEIDKNSSLPVVAH